MTNYLFDRKKLVLTVLENNQGQMNDELVQSHIAYILHKLSEPKAEKEDPYDKEKIILPRQRSYIQEIKEKNKFRKEKRTRMVYDEEKKGWTLRRNKKKASSIPPIIEANNKDAYEDVFRKREISEELKRSKVKLSLMKKNIKKQKSTGKNRNA